MLDATTAAALANVLVDDVFDFMSNPLVFLGDIDGPSTVAHCRVIVSVECHAAARMHAVLWKRDGFTVDTELQCT